MFERERAKIFLSMGISISNGQDHISLVSSAF
jgi:hypothetical protein